MEYVFVDERRLKKMLLLTKVKGFSIIELLIICCLVFILIGTFGVYANKILTGARENALKYELAGLRQYIKLFYILHKKSPKNIAEFCVQKSGRFDKEGNLLDTFGHKYIYSPLTREIKSSSAGYENW